MCYLEPGNVLPGADCWWSGISCSWAQSQTHLAAQSPSSISEQTNSSECQFIFRTVSQKNRTRVTFSNNLNSPISISTKCWEPYTHPDYIQETRELVRMQSNVQPVWQPLTDHLHLSCIPHLYKRSKPNTMSKTQQFSYKILLLFFIQLACFSAVSLSI